MKADIRMARERSPARRVAGFGILLALALVLHAVEGLLPTPLPFARLGLANIVTLLAVVAFGLADAVLLTALRVMLASLLAGTFLGPGFAMSLAGGLTAAVAMWAVFRLWCPPLGIVGVSLVGAAAHNVAQVVTVGTIFTGAAAAARLLPVALLLAAVAGLATGLAAHFVLARIRPGQELRT